MPTKLQIWKKTDGRCHMCGGTLTLSKSKDRTRIFNKGHILARKHRGRNIESNLLPECAWFNKKRGAKTPAEIREMILLGWEALRRKRR
jgi:hypothetical protein